MKIADATRTLVLWMPPSRQSGSTYNTTKDNQDDQSDKSASNTDEGTTRLGEKCAQGVRKQKIMSPRIGSRVFTGTQLFGSWLVVAVALLIGGGHAHAMKSSGFEGACCDKMEEADFFDGRLHIILPPGLRDVDVLRDASTHAGTLPIQMGCSGSFASMRVFALTDGHQRSGKEWSELVLNAYGFQEEKQIRVVAGSERKHDVTINATFRQTGRHDWHAYMRTVVIEDTAYVVLFVTRDKRAWRKLRRDFARSARSMTIQKSYPYPF